MFYAEVFYTSMFVFVLFKYIWDFFFLRALQQCLYAEVFSSPFQIPFVVSPHTAQLQFSSYNLHVFFLCLYLKTTSDQKWPAVHWKMYCLAKQKLSQEFTWCLGLVPCGKQMQERKWECKLRICLKVGITE